MITVKDFVMIMLVCSSLPRMSLARDMSLTLQNNQTGLMLVIHNSSDHEVKINHSFSLNSLIGPIRLKVKQNGRLLDLRAEGNAEVPSEGLYVTLYPGQIMGNEYDIPFIRLLYGMDGGCYVISASYEDSAAAQFNAYDKKITSNSITLCFKDSGRPRQTEK
jgi:hypothetical protein